MGIILVKMQDAKAHRSRFVFISSKSDSGTSLANIFTTPIEEEYKAVQLMFEYQSNLHYFEHVPPIPYNHNRNDYQEEDADKTVPFFKCHPASDYAT